VLLGALDADFEVVCTDREDGGKEATATSASKAKNWAKPRPLRGLLIPIELEGTEGEAVSGITLKELSQGATYNLTSEVRALFATIGGSKGAPLSERGLEVATGIPRKRLREMLADGVKTGMLARNEAKNRTLLHTLTEQGVMAISQVVPKCPENGSCGSVVSEEKNHLEPLDKKQFELDQ
jgi:hypothetical protein